MEGQEIDVFRTVFDEHYPIVRRKLMALIQDEAAAEDLAQEVFIRLYRNPPDDPAAIGAWLHRVLTRIGYDYMSKQIRERKLKEKQEQYFDRREQLLSSGEEIVLKRMDQEEVREWMDELPERDRQLLMLKYSGYSYAEIAEELNVRPPLVGSMLSRATSKLRRKVQGKSAPQS
ncbi:sigma-70 family RNA polymerase sigma factor [Paenibacillus urinalis]|uniref:Sigma-70 family RNA polymerase sigma factor n=1 Tax=Paenibacillus urinalis TaxID=521520 RepID=A0AAX3N1M0_9BACL|nr:MULTISPECIES: sigma-70 family RNA polymerase sigma factor [Paenibacillus]WDH83645.1 sigma-70 family RNA polymerase sigma factor [Paenibacillus urinalis]WDH99673.1 sigma-70 family RNA polymerase sigma factor [Paenibacillus urinalis]WDI03306.1 sigma-70 family RNA polymerase sigma factor [Paenibacillus urinalis]GAK42414.1 ECF subfamily RNA polymerase sigma-24 subunit [Paenibacillus sp. TCA20]